MIFAQVRKLPRATVASAHSTCAGSLPSHTSWNMASVSVSRPGSMPVTWCQVSTLERNAGARAITRPPTGTPAPSASPRTTG